MNTSHPSFGIFKAMVVAGILVPLVAILAVYAFAWSLERVMAEVTNLDEHRQQILDDDDRGLW